MGKHNLKKLSTIGQYTAQSHDMLQTLVQVTKNMFHMKTKLLHGGRKWMQNRKE